MLTPSKEQRMSFWMHSYARSSFVQARIFVDLLLRVAPAMNDPLRHALTVAILATYCRPFKQRKAVRLPEDVVPSQFRNTHDGMVEIRDTVVAHRDLDGPVADWGFISQLQLNVRSGELTFDTISSIIPDEKAREILPLIDSLISAMDANIDAFVLKYLRDLPQVDASYVVSLDDNPDLWLIRTKA